MGLFDALTGDAGHQAATQQRNALGLMVPQLANVGQTAYGQAGDQLAAGYGQARTDLGTGYGASTGAINTGAGGALGYLGNGISGAMGQLDQARGALTAGGGAYAPLGDLAGQYGKGAGLYADSLGINGAGGNQNAVNAFQAGPGYNFALDQGIDAINRKRNAAGMLNGGNADRDAQIYGQGLANQEYGKWQDRLGAYNPLQLQAATGYAQGNQAINSGVANTYGAGAGLLDASGRAQASVAQGQGNSLADVANRYYGGLGGLDTGGGTAQALNTIGGAQNYQGIFGKGLDQWNGTYQQDAKASEEASKNSLNLGVNLAKLAAGAAGGGGFGGGSGGSSFLPSSSFMNNSWGY